MAEVNQRIKSRVFQFRLTGDQVYDLTEVLREVALETGSYETARQCVILEQIFWTQQREQGWGTGD